MNYKKNERKIVSSSECFNKGIAGNCSEECPYYKYEGCEIEEELMTGIEALEELKKGKVIRRKQWNPEYYIYLNRNGEVVDGTGNSGTVLVSSFLEDGWESFDNSEKAVDLIKVIKFKIDKLEKELKEIAEEVKVKEEVLHNEYIKLIKAKYNLTEKRMNSRFKFKNGFYNNEVFGKIKFDKKSNETIKIYHFKKNGELYENCFQIDYRWLEDTIWLDEINSDKEN